MESLPDNNFITEDGEYRLPLRPTKGTQTVEVSGDFGGGTVTIGYVDSSGVFAAFVDANGDDYTATGSTMWDRVPVPVSGIVVLKVSGADASAIRVAQRKNI